MSIKSTNFEFVRPTWPELSGLGGFAEQYAQSDPSSAAVKLRAYAEQLVAFIVQRHNLPRVPRANLNDLLESHALQQAVPSVIVTKLHELRISGNHAAHGAEVKSRQVLYLLKEAFDLGCWLSMTYAGTTKERLPSFIEPQSAPGIDSKEQIKREKKAVLEKLAAAESQMQQLLSELDTTRSKATTAEATVAELQAALHNGQRAANVLQFDEATTRKRLIDTMLLTAEWDVDPDGRSTNEVGQEIEVDGQPTSTGKGLVDYVLWDDQTGKPLAVIEAKKTAKSAEEGRTQAKLYADALERKHGQRPLIFYTNGFETTLWNDSDGEPPRRVYGIYAKDSLQYVFFKRGARQAPGTVQPDPNIANRMYQIEAVSRIVERFAAKSRKALIVQATGTGKTRVAISLAAALTHANWAKRVLFLCDRRELRKQAANAFKDYLPDLPRTVVSADTAQDRNCRIYLATYPAMSRIFETFDVGFFDLIIADESHRSIYNRYRDIFLYFDAMEVGLTATPVTFISRNTYNLFGCEDQDPTVHYGFNDAINHVPPYLVPFKVQQITTAFQRDGIKYSQMPEDQRRQLEEDEIEPEKVEFHAHQVDKQVFNRDTNRIILRNLMEHGVKVKGGQQIGKSIIFARNHNHAVLLQTLFDEMYPQYGGKFCRVIDNYDPRAEDLIDDFKGIGTNPDLTIAISVDMLDTGIDVPAVVNLVFAKPVFSYVKFWQMIGRGTRLCENLFGPGHHKTHFLIFDHWGNFTFFDEQYEPVEPNSAKALLHRLFEARLTLAETALTKPDTGAFDLAAGLISKDIADLPEKTISVREKWKSVSIVRNDQVVRHFEPATVVALRQDIAPLMQWRDIAGDETAYVFDLLMCRLQTEWLRQSARFDDFKAQLLATLDDLVMHLSQVKAKADTIAELRTQAFWDTATAESLEHVRTELRGVVRHRIQTTTPRVPPKMLDIKEDQSLVERREYKPKLEGLDLAAYRKRVEQALTGIFATNPTLQRIKAGQSVTDADLQALVSLVLTQYPDLDLTDLTDYFPETAGHLDMAIRAIIGLDAAAVDQVFQGFVRKHNLNSTQIRFLSLLQNHIARYGAIELGRLYDAPFTSVHSEGLDGVFTDEGQLDELLSLISKFSPQGPKGIAQA